MRSPGCHHLYHWHFNSSLKPNEYLNLVLRSSPKHTYYFVSTRMGTENWKTMYCRAVKTLNVSLLSRNQKQLIWQRGRGQRWEETNDLIQVDATGLSLLSSRTLVSYHQCHVIKVQTDLHNSNYRKILMVLGDSLIWTRWNEWGP